MNESNSTRNSPAPGLLFLTLSSGSPSLPWQVEHWVNMKPRTFSEALQESTLHFSQVTSVAMNPDAASTLLKEKLAPEQVADL